MKHPEPSETLLSATARILRPLIKLLLRYGVTYAAFADIAKKTFFYVAKEEFIIPGKRQTTSRISTMTGLSRKEVARQEALPQQSTALDTSGINRAARVISGWVRDADFQTSSGEPADLPFEGGQYSFAELVKRYSGDITARTIADELSRIGAVSTTAAGYIHLNTRAYIASSSDQDKLAILGTDVADLINTIDHNLSNPNPPYFQRKVSYNYLPVELLPELREQISHISQYNLESLDSILSEKAIAKESTKKGKRYARIGVGIYYFETEQKDENN
jgi:hypothetical protein